MKPRKRVPAGTNFQGLYPRPPPKFYPKTMKRCPSCKGFGKSNVELNSFGDDQHLMTPCHACWGFGWIEFDKVVG